MEPIYHNPPWTLEEVVTPLAGRPQSWGIGANNLPAQWPKTEGQYTRVCILDTGVDEDHPDLQDAIATARDFTGSRFGYYDRQGHGTHCAGVVMQVAPLCRLWIGKVLGDDGSGRSEWICNGIQWAIDQKCHVISMSLGSPYDDPRIRAMVKKAIDAGIIVVIAAGNDGGRVNSPAIHGLAVSAYDENFKLAPFSSRGPEIITSGPGTNILSSVPLAMGGYAKMSGTSMATPFVAGVVALARTYNEASMKDQKAAIATLMQHSKDVGVPGFDPLYGWGLISPESLMANDPEPEPVLDPPSVVIIGKTVVYKDGSVKHVPSGNSWEYENDPDWLVTVPLEK